MPGLFALPPCHSPQLISRYLSQDIVVILLHSTVLLLRDYGNRKRFFICKPVFDWQYNRQNT
ncbi:hypothetical protein D1K53_22090 [Salmonella enterica]|nr:hypothetical protein [Salmonella enterica]EGW1916961.1 hypothetical protein [Salmonella enterica]